MKSPYYQKDGVTIYHGDCRDILPSLSGDIISDVPYGIGLKFGGVGCKTADKNNPVLGDEVPFDPSHLLGFNKIVLWGANHYSSKLPDTNGWLVWDKSTRPAVSVFSEAELAWTNCLERVYVYRHLWSGAYRQSEQGYHVHPTQKPVSLMRWVIDLVKPELIIDPYMGSGSTIQAAKDFGIPAIGIELEEKYCRVAVKRLAQPSLFTLPNNRLHSDRATPEGKQAELFNVDQSKSSSGRKPPGR
jgi:site-specific DNA-methyltransferase (adenine-specific)